MKIKNFYPIGLSILSIFFLVSITLFSISCKITEEGIETIEQDLENPILLEFSQKDEKTFSLVFSEEVSVNEIQIHNEQELLYNENFIQVEKNEKSISLKLTDDVILEIGQPYSLIGIATDSNKNRLTFQIPFHGFNKNLPGIVISEIRTEYTKPKLEYIELYVHTPGNLAGISLYNAYDDKYGEYIFPASEVNAGEYIVVHLRTPEEEKSLCIDETGTDLNQSTSEESCTDARDFWIENTKARLGKTDVILLRERTGGNIMDAVLYAENDETEWKSEIMTKVADECFSQGIWEPSGQIENAVDSTGLTSARTLSRQNITEIDYAAESGTEFPINNASNWFVTVNLGKEKGATPGYINSKNKYEP